MTQDSITTEQPAGLNAFLMTLRPRRSADPKFAYTVLGALALVWFFAGLYFSTMGGWPLFGFFGGEFLIIAAMVRVFLKGTETVEIIEIQGDKLTITRRERGLEERQEFQTYWASAYYRHDGTTNDAVEIGSHGKRMAIGHFLTRSEKMLIEAQINDTLRRFKTIAAHQSNIQD